MEETALRKSISRVRLFKLLLGPYCSHIIPFVHELEQSIEPRGPHNPDND
jgi:hypothetical protein